MSNDNLITATNRTVDEIRKRITFADWHKYDDTVSDSDIRYNIALAGFKKFELPDHSAASERKRETVSNFIRLDRTLPDVCSNEPHLICRNPSPEGKFRMEEARRLLQSSLKGEHLRDEDAWFGPGESFLGHHGYTSALSKLLSQQWSVTLPARKHMVSLLFRNRRIRSLIAQDCWRSFRAGKYYNLQVTRSWFNKKLYVVPGNRLSVVPKNNEKDRTIGVEPLLNMMYQKQIGAILRRSNKKLGNDLDDGQQRHQTMIKSRKWATIDLSSASDLLDCGLVAYFLPAWLFQHVWAARSHYTLVENGWIKQRKISSMGNGFTFELMSLILLSIARTFDKNASVYGDDIVLSRDVAVDFINYLNKETSFIVNQEKSFWDGRVRESCGSFFVGTSEVTRYDFKCAESRHDCITLRNKAYRVYLGLVKSGCDAQVFKAMYTALDADLDEYDVPYGPIVPSLSTVDPSREPFVSALLDGLPHSKDLEVSENGRSHATLGLYRESTNVGKWRHPRDPRDIKRLEQFMQDYCYNDSDLFMCRVQVWKGGSALKHANHSWKHLAMLVLLHDRRPPTVARRGSGRWKWRTLILHKRLGILSLQ